MKNNIVLSLGLSGLIFSSVSSADGILSESMNRMWRPVVGLGGGVAVPESLGQYSAFPILNPLSDIYYIYTPNSSTQTKGLFEAFLGAERQFAAFFILQGGLAYTYTGNSLVKGNLVQGADYLSDNLFNYQYKIGTQELLAQAKFMLPYQNRIYPYVLGCLGVAFNNVSEFQTTVPSNLSSTRFYNSNKTNSFAYRVGLGIDTDITKHARLGVAYRFNGVGSIGLGTASLNGVPVPGTLSQNSLNFNEVLAQLTYVM